MTLNELIKELKAIAKVHPEAKDAQVWYYTEHGIHNIGYDQKHTPARIVLEE